MRFVYALLSVSTFAACASSGEALRASDSSSSAPGAGAYYDINPKGAIIGDAKVWSNGAHEENDIITVEVGLRIRNNASEEIALDLSGCGLEIVGSKDVQVVEDETITNGTVNIPAGGLERITLKYTLPAKTDLDKVSGFDFYWRVQTPDGPYTHSTAFQRAVRENSGGYYYSPYFYGGGFYNGFGPYWGPNIYYGGGGYRPAPPVHTAPPRR